MLHRFVGIDIVTDFGARRFGGGAGRTCCRRSRSCCLANGVRKLIIGIFGNSTIFANLCCCLLNNGICLVFVLHVVQIRQVL